MSHNRIRYTGLEDLKAELRDLPEALHGEAEHIVDAHANRAALAVRAKYGIVTGELVTGVVVETVQRTRYFAGRQVVSRGHLAYIYENGTEVRHTALGYNRGRMPPAHVFVPVMIRQRVAMYSDLSDLLRRHGLAVRGVAA